MTIQRRQPIEPEQDPASMYLELLHGTIGFAAADRQVLARFRDLCGKLLERVVEDFYAWMQGQPRLRELIGSDPRRVQKLKRSFRRWLEQILGDELDDGLIREHLAIGRQHLAIGVWPAFLLASAHLVRSSILQVAHDLGAFDRDELHAFQQALGKVITFEEILLNDGYHRGQIDELAQEGQVQRRELEERQARLVREASSAQQGLLRILQNPIAPILLVDRRHRIVFFNAAAQRAFGYQGDAAPSRRLTLRDLAAPEDWSRVEAEVARVFGGEQTPFLQWNGLSRNGADVDLASTLFPAGDLDGEPVCALLSLDVTEQTHLREELERAEKLATIGRLAAMVAHEVGNPLAGMQGVLEIVRARLAEDSEERQLLGKVLDRTVELAHLIRDLLVMSRPVEVHPVEAPLSVFFRELVAALDRQRDLLDCSIQIHCEPEDLRAEFDPVQLRRAVTNLVLNAAHAASAVGGRGVRLLARRHAGQVVIEVEDDGPGLSKEVRREMFTPFYTTKKGGTGLGLPITREIVRKHGGWLSAENMDGGGARFRIALPDKLDPNPRRRSR